MKGELCIRNRQRRWTVDLHRLRTLVAGFLDTAARAPGWQLGVHLVGASAMARLNRRWLAHEGSTDVLTFDHAAPGEPLHGELFVSVDDAAAASRQFRTSPCAEVVRYIVHGVLHLQGYDDARPADRRRMKRVEDAWMRRLAADIPSRGLVRRSDGKRSPRACDRTTEAA